MQAALCCKNNQPQKRFKNSVQNAQKPAILRSKIEKEISRVGHSHFSDPPQYGRDTTSLPHLPAPPHRRLWRVDIRAFGARITTIPALLPPNSSPHCENSLGSFNVCTTAPSGRRPSDRDTCVMGLFLK